MVTHRFKYEFYRSRVAAGVSASAIGVRKTGRMFKMSPSLVSYWKNKVRNPQSLSQQWGGARFHKFTKEQLAAIHCILWKRAKAKPLSRLGEYRRELRKHNLHVGLSTICRIFKSWQWSFKKPHRKQFNKYRPENLEYYASVKYFFQTIPWSKLKFADESHFKSADLQRTRAISPKGEPLDIVTGDMNDETFSMTLMTNLDPNAESPIVATLRTESNTQWDFLEFVVNLLEYGHLVSGDYLFVDNAAVHNGIDAFRVLSALLDAAGVTLLFLPKYSPELNPCEEVFAQIKAHLRNYRGSDRFWFEIVKAASVVTYKNILKYYEHAIVLK